MEKGVVYCLTCKVWPEQYCTEATFLRAATVEHSVIFRLTRAYCVWLSWISCGLLLSFVCWSYRGTLWSLWPLGGAKEHYFKMGPCFVCIVLVQACTRVTQCKRFVCLQENFTEHLIVLLSSDFNVNINVSFDQQPQNKMLSCQNKRPWQDPESQP